MAGGADSLWVAGGGRLQRRDPETGEVGAEIAIDIAEPLAAVVLDDRTIVLAGPDGSLAGHRQDTLDPVFKLGPRRGGDLLAAGGGSAWSARSGERGLLRLSPDGQAERLDSGPVTGLTADAQGAWRVEAGAPAIVNEARRVRLPARSDGPVAIAACAGAVWLSTDDGLLWVRSRAAELGGVMASPVGRVPRLTCASGVLVGGERFDGVLMVNPAADNRARRLELDADGPVLAMAGARGILWLVDKDSVAHLIPL